MTAHSASPDLREAATALVKAWDEHGCPICGGTGVAWDWPDAQALRAALQASPAPEGRLHKMVTDFSVTGAGRDFCLCGCPNSRRDWAATGEAEGLRAALEGLRRAIGELPETDLRVTVNDNGVVTGEHRRSRSAHRTKQAAMRLVDDLLAATGALAATGRDEP